MAVHTPVLQGDLEVFLAGYDLGRLLSFEGILKGIENSNFLLTLGDHAGRSQRFILTLFERRTPERDLPFFLSFMSHLSGRGIPCSQARHARSGETILQLNGRPAAVFEFMTGAEIRRPSLAHVAKIGALLARMHQAVRDFTPVRPNAMGPKAWAPLLQAAFERVPEVPGLQDLIVDAKTVEELWPASLPTGAVHADLFPDNVFFDDRGEVSGVLDFYFSATDIFAYDLMITFNAWCFDDTGHFLPQQADALMTAYEKLRPLSPAEKAALPFLGRAAALRILATRHYDRVFTAPGVRVVAKDPAPYRRIWMFHREKS